MPSRSEMVPAVHSSPRTARDECSLDDAGAEISGEGGTVEVIVAGILPAGDSFGDPALEFRHLGVVAVVGHQAMAEHIGKYQEAACAGFIV